MAIPGFPGGLICTRDIYLYPLKGHLCGPCYSLLPSGLLLFFQLFFGGKGSGSFKLNQHKKWMPKRRGIFGKIGAEVQQFQLGTEKLQVGIVQYTDTARIAPRLRRSRGSRISRGSPGPAVFGGVGGELFWLGWFP